MAAMHSMLCCMPTAAFSGCQFQPKSEIASHCYLKFGHPSASFALLCDSGGGRSRNRRGCSFVARVGAQEDGSSREGGFEVDKTLESILKNDESQKLMDMLAKKALEDEESAALLKDFAAAAERVARAKEELESIDKRERELAEMVSAIISQAADEDTEVASSVTEGERAVMAAQQELKAAEIALVTARAGTSAGNLTRKWECEDIDEDLERVESGNAAAVSALAGTLASIPFLLTGNDLGIGPFLSIGGVVVSCALFGVTYRYILRRDLGNIQLKLGATAAFALVRGIGQVDAIQLHVGFPAQGEDAVLLAALHASKGLLSFGFSALALDYCLAEGIISPFPFRK